MTALDDLERRLVAFADGDVRRVVGLAGPPASGKSTLAARLRDRLDARHPGRAALLGLDGFRYDDRLPEPWCLLHRKGAAETFDTDGPGAVLDRLATTPHNPRRRTRLRPRTGGCPRRRRHHHPGGPIGAGGGQRPPPHRPDRAAVRARFTLTVYLDAPPDTLCRRLEARWRDVPADRTAAKIDDNDLPNTRLVAAESVSADVTLSTDDLDTTPD